MSDYATLAASIVDGVGGPANIKSVEHCITRLRFSLVDSAKVDRAGIEALEGVVGVRDQQGGAQVIIGQAVDDVYDELMKLVDLNAAQVVSEATGYKQVEAPSGNPVARFMNLLSECFVPLIPMLIACGLTSAIATLLSSSGLLASDSIEYQVISFMGSAPLYFLPFAIAASAGKRAGVNIYLTIAVMATLMYPNLAGLAEEGASYISFFGLPIRMATYSNSVFPALLVVGAQYFIEKAAKRVIPKLFQVFLQPLVVYLILTLLALFILGPLATFVGDGLAVIFNALSGEYRPALCVIFGTLYILLVSTGLHHSIRAVNITIFAMYGFDPFWGGMAMGSNMALAGAVLALLFSSKDDKTRQLAASTGLPAFLGVTEPAIFGVAFNNRRVLVSAMVGGGVAGLVGGILGINGYGMGPAGVMSIPLFIGDTFPHLIIAMVLGFVVGFAGSFVLDKRAVAAKE